MTLFPCSEGGIYRRFVEHLHKTADPELLNRIVHVSRCLMDLLDEKTAERLRQLHAAIVRFDDRFAPHAELRLFYPRYLEWAKDAEDRIHVPIAIARNLESVIREIFPFVRKDKEKVA